MNDEAKARMHVAQQVLEKRNFRVHKFSPHHWQVSYGRWQMHYWPTTNRWRIKQPLAMLSKAKTYTGLRTMVKLMRRNPDEVKSLGPTVFKQLLDQLSSPPSKGNGA